MEINSERWEYSTPFKLPSKKKAITHLNCHICLPSLTSLNEINRVEQ